MDNQHRQITGYRELSMEELTLMNQIKEKAKEVGELVEQMRKIGTLDQRWVFTGATDLQKGFMSLVRAVAQPTTF